MQLMGDRLRWWRSRRRRAVIAVALVLSVLFVAVNLMLALGQWDPTRSEFQPGVPVGLSLTRGETRIVYLGATESQPLNFDFYPSDFSCSAVGPAGQVELEPLRHHRLLNVWEDHAAVGSFEVPETGVYQLSCRGRDAKLIVARPALFMVGWVSPQFAAFFLALMAVVAAAVLLVDVLVGKLRGHRAAGSERAGLVR